MHFFFLQLAIPRLNFTKNYNLTPIVGAVTENLVLNMGTEMVRIILDLAAHFTVIQHRPMMPRVYANNNSFASGTL